MGLGTVARYSGVMPTEYDGSPVNISVGPLGYVLIVQPEQVKQALSGGNATSSFLAWYDENKGWIESNLLQYGGFVFRGFGLKDAQDFDEVLGSVHPDMMAEVGIYVCT
jgi:hypothetical protein